MMESQAELRMEKYKLQIKELKMKIKHEETMDLARVKEAEKPESVKYAEKIKTDYRKQIDESMAEHGFFIGNFTPAVDSDMLIAAHEAGKAIYKPLLEKLKPLIHIFKSCPMQDVTDLMRDINFEYKKLTPMED